jgi:acetylornithine deacetylase/succinyl-diaminopimelate desuccinylase-like protein
MIKSYIETHRERFLNELFDLLRLPSVSADSRHKEDVRKTAELVKTGLLAAGVDNAEICETPGHPIA